MISSILLWSLLGLSGITMLFWLYEQYVGWARYDPPDAEYTPDAAQVRILTIGREPSVVQRTVDSLPTVVDDIVVVTEQEITIEGALTRVVPSSFTCDAEKKGRALEWARRNVDCDKEYVLYLDEDTQAGNFDGLPDADIVQYGEKPLKTSSLLAYWVEIFRMGFQVEMRAFSKFDVPLYAWGGGIAIRQELEDNITWNFSSIIEDTSFVWRSANQEDIDFMYYENKFRNQAPPSMSALIQQRRRWFAGSIRELNILSKKFYFIAILRNTSWVLSAVVPLLGVFSWLQIGITPGMFHDLYTLLCLIPGAFIASWAIVGLRYMDSKMWTGIVVLVLSPVLSFLNAIGALYGIVSPPDSFSVTEKSTKVEDIKAK